VKKLAKTIKPKGKPNLKYDVELYNGEIKTNYLNEKYAVQTIKTLLRIFKISSKKEHELKKDIYAFSREELRLLLYLYMPKKLNSSIQNGTIIGNYIDWAIENGYTEGVNPLDGVFTDWYHQFVNKRIKQYFSENELNTFIDGCINKQDAVTLSLFMEGLTGLEMINLQEKDIDFENCELKVNVKNKAERTIKVSENCIKLCEMALKEKIYYKANGKINGNTKSATTNLVTNNYVLKSSITRTLNTGQAAINIVFRRITTLSKYFDRAHLQPRNISYSGMLMMARNLMKRDGVLAKDQYNEICTQFNLSKPIKGSLDYNYTRLKKEFLNEDKVKELYPGEFK
jgi:site-specific recombinase XerD